MPAILSRLRDGLVALAYPQMCRVCNAPVESLDDGVVCASCWENPQVTPLFLHPTGCLKCGIPSLRSINSLPSANPQSACEQCRQLPFHYARSCGAYAGALEANVMFLKSQPHLCRRLRQLLQQTFRAHQEFLQCDVVMPVPLHRDREQQRGFNQAALIARLLSKAFHLRLDCHTLTRIKYTEKHRVGMDAHDRAQSVKNAFQVADADAILGASVLIIDDVLTTGSTIGEITKTLVKAGAAEVNLLTLARVIREIQIDIRHDRDSTIENSGNMNYTD